MTQMMGLSRIRNGFWSIQFSNIKSKLCPKSCVNFLSELAANCDANIRIEKCWHVTLYYRSICSETFTKNRHIEFLRVSSIGS